MTTRFSILIVDDDSTISSGWQRIIERLKWLGYLDTSVEYPLQAPADAAIAWDVVTSKGFDEYGSALERAIAALRSSAEDKYLVHVLDVDLSKDCFLPEELRVVYSNGEEEYVRFIASDQSINYIDGKRSVFRVAAGAWLPMFLPPNSPVIVYTGSNDPITLQRVGNLRDDRRFDLVEFINHPDFNKKLEAYLDTLLLKHQKRVVLRTPFTKQLAACSLLEGGNWQSLENLELTDGFTVKTLFPKQFTKREPDLIRSLMSFDWRRVTQAALNHSDGYGAIALARMGDAAAIFDFAKTCDFRVGHAASWYRPISQFPSFSHLASVRKTLWRELEEYALPQLSCFQQKLGSELDLRSDAKNYGLNPVDLAYIVSIAKQNGASHLGAEIFTLLRVDDKNGPSSDNPKLHFQFHFVSDQPLNWEKLKSQALAKFDREGTRSPDFLLVLDDQGLQDICRIVCGRYRGRFFFKTPVGSLVAILSLSNHTLEVSWRHDLVSEPGCCYEIQIPYEE